MLKGLHLTMLIGPVIPIPAPQVVIDALQSVSVETGETALTDGEGDKVGSASETSFQLSFRLGKRSSLQTIFLLTGGVPLPLRVVLIATLNGLPQVLVDGMVVNQQVSPGDNGGDAILTLTGKDLSSVMDLQEFTGLPYPALGVEEQVGLILTKYVIPWGIAPMVIPTAFPEVPLPIDRVPTHSGSDLDHLRQRAALVGYTFCMLTPAPLVNIAYWGPQLRIGPPQSALNVDMDGYTNVDSIHFGFENRDRSQPILQVQIPGTTRWLPVPLPDVSLLNPPLGLVEPLPSDIYFVSDIGGRSPIEVALQGLADAAESMDCTTAEGTLDVLRYGAILQARSLVGVRGAGLGFDGLYYVKSVKHDIKRGEYKQSFELVRNGLISTVPVVLP
jgi:hypothetical protein